MRVLLLAGPVPFRRHGVPGVIAANIVSGALMASLRDREYAMGLQIMFDPSRKDERLRPEEEEELRYWETQGITVLPPIFLSSIAPAGVPSRFRTARLFDPDTARRFFYPAVQLQPLLRERIREAGAERLLTIWNTDALAATRGLGVPTVAYHGDLGFQPGLLQLKDWRLFSGRRPRLQDAAIHRLRFMARRACELKLLKEVEVLAHITACNAAHYAAEGHPRSVYVGNTWVEPAAMPPRPTADPARPFTIIGHMGALNRTASTYGLAFLLREFLPALEHELGDHPFTVQVIGGEEPMPSLRPLMRHPRVVHRGFVPDLDSEIVGADCVCLFNNAGPLLAAFTRHLVTWSLGGCLAVHDRSKLALPEVEPGVNVIGGADGPSIARHVAEVLRNPARQKSIRTGGMTTFHSHFTPSIIAGKLSPLLESAAL
ncbi:MAG: Uncharacterized protein Greene041619_911 [Candidatus Peregrinibacteria bacterium Greene0416_19]|nr:MAG: Uncharacterized protein Greene041619_911 [Candidatus Peregrinibacteria bacterium Greene0416_19]